MQSERPTTAEELQAKMKSYCEENSLDFNDFFAKDRSIITYCKGGGRGKIGANLLKNLGFTNAQNGVNADTIREQNTEAEKAGFQINEEEFQSMLVGLLRRAMAVERQVAGETESR